jgi:hypothetical protein
MRWAVLVSLLALSSARPIAAQPQVGHTAWDLLLKRHVASGLVDYEGFQQDRAALERYLASLQDVQPSQLGSRDAQLAFWINAYNAYVVKGVLDHYPIASVKEVKGFFDRIRYRVAGRELTLNEIEGEGRALGDWRIHFAVVCASSSCPILRPEAYAADRLEAQLTEQTREFLNDPQRGLRIEAGTLWVSKIFKWYAKDFVPKGPLTAASLWPVLNSYITVEGLPPIADMPLKFLDYDWSLNVQRR